jgi:hypothetical protein
MGRQDARSPRTTQSTAESIDADTNSRALPNDAAIASSRSMLGEARKYISKGEYPLLKNCVLLHFRDELPGGGVNRAGSDLLTGTSARLSRVGVQRGKSDTPCVHVRPGGKSSRRERVIEERSKRRNNTSFGAKNVPKTYDTHATLRICSSKERQFTNSHQQQILPLLGPFLTCSPGPTRLTPVVRFPDARSAIKNASAAGR